MRDFDGDINKLATHRQTTPFPPPFHRGGFITAASIPAFDRDIEHVIPKETAEKLRAAGKTLTVEINVKDLVTPIIKRIIGEALLDFGAFPFMVGQQPQRLVVIESPFGHPTKVGMEENAIYARKCMLDSLSRNEAPYASHLLYTQCLDDLKVAERKQGMEAGFAWGRVAQHVAVYTDRGVSRGMLEGIKRHQANDLTIEFRSIA